MQRERGVAHTARHRTRAIEVQIRDSHLRTRASQAPRDGLADSGGRAGNDGGLARQIKCHGARATRL